ncbi:MAG: ankyrin repeat domain-containing protein, partial [Nitrospira sp.]|nr:ankyrin repeat domain-containing protein [Nitrospira sp.]
MPQSREFTMVKYVAVSIGILLSYALASEWNTFSFSQEPDLIQAIQHRNFPLAQKLIIQGSDINQRTPQGATPLHFSARSGQF